MAGPPSGSTVPHVWHSPQRPTQRGLCHPHSPHRCDPACLPAACRPTVFAMPGTLGKPSDSSLTSAGRWAPPGYGLGRGLCAGLWLGRAVGCRDLRALPDRGSPGLRRRKADKWVLRNVGNRETLINNLGVGRPGDGGGRGERGEGTKGRGPTQLRSAGWGATAQAGGAVASRCRQSLASSAYAAEPMSALSSAA